MKIDFNKGDGLVPVVIIQNANTLQVLMLGYMNEEAYQKDTFAANIVTFFSRSKNRLMDQRRRVWEYAFGARHYD